LSSLPHPHNHTGPYTFVQGRFFRSTRCASGGCFASQRVTCLIPSLRRRAHHRPTHPDPTKQIIGVGATYDYNDDDVQCRQHKPRREKGGLLHSEGSRQKVRRMKGREKEEGGGRGGGGQIWPRSRLPLCYVRARRHQHPSSPLCFLGACLSVLPVVVPQRRSRRAAQGPLDG
jgi:hypothetical protein